MRDEASRLGRLCRGPPGDLGMAFGSNGSLLVGVVFFPSSPFMGVMLFPSSVR